MHHSGRGRAGGGRGRALAAAIALLAGLGLLAGACSGSGSGGDGGDGGDAGEGAAGDASSGETSSDAAGRAGAGTTTTTAPPPYERYALDNGLDVVLYPVDGAERTALLVAYEVGERHDPPGQSGLAHVTEQVYSTAGTGLVPPRAAFELVTRYDGRWWSETGDDHTVMAREFPNADLDAEITEAAARMLSLTVTPEDLERERERVLLDIDAGLAADPDLAARTRAEELIQPSANGGNQMGIPAQVAQLELPVVVERLNQIYKPANATLVLVGGFDPLEAKATIDRFFGLVPPGQEAGEGAPWGLAGFGEVASVIVNPRPDAEPGVSTASVGYLAPPPGDPTYPAFLTHVARMRSAAAAAGMSVGYAPLQTPGVVTVSAPLLLGESELAVVERIRAWIADQVVQPLDDADRELVVEEAATTFGAGGHPESQLRDDPFSVALALARTAQLGIDPDELAAALEELTDADLEVSAAATFGAERSAAAVVLVEPA